MEPENRLVARELERRWEQALKDHQQLEREYEAFLSGQPGHLSPEEREELLALSHDLPAVWRAPTTTPADRQRIARLLLDRVVVTVVGTSEQVAVRLEWAGGHTGDHVIIRPVARYDQRRDYPKLVARLRELHGQRLSSAAIAEHLNREGFRPPKRTTRFQRGMVHRLLTKLGLGRPRVPPEDERAPLGPHEWWLGELSKHLGIPRDTLHRWRRVGWVHAQARRTARPLGALGRRGRVGAAQPLEDLPQDLGQSAAAEGADDPQGAGPMMRSKRFFRGSGRRGGAAAGSPIQVAPSEALWLVLGTPVQALEVAQPPGRVPRDVVCRGADGRVLGEADRRDPPALAAPDVDLVQPAPQPLEGGPGHPPMDRVADRGSGRCRPSHRGLGGVDHDDQCCRQQEATEEIPEFVPTPIESQNF